MRRVPSSPAPVSLRPAAPAPATRLGDSRSATRRRLLGAAMAMAGLAGAAQSHAGVAWRPAGNPGSAEQGLQTAPQQIPCLATGPGAARFAGEVVGGVCRYHDGAAERTAQASSFQVLAVTGTHARFREAFYQDDAGRWMSDGALTFTSNGRTMALCLGTTPRNGQMVRTLGWLDVAAAGTPYCITHRGPTGDYSLFEAAPADTFVDQPPRWQVATQLDGNMTGALRAQSAMFCRARANATSPFSLPGMVILGARTTCRHALRLDGAGRPILKSTSTPSEFQVLIEPMPSTGLRLAFPWAFRGVEFSGHRQNQLRAGQLSGKNAFLCLADQAFGRTAAGVAVDGRCHVLAPIGVVAVDSEGSFSTLGVFRRIGR